MATLARADLEFDPTTDDAPAPAATTAVSRLDPEAVFRGMIEASGTFEIAGRVEGDVDAETLVIARGGQVTGEVAADSMTIAGAFKGTLRCKSLTITDTATVEGEIHYERVAIETGASVEANFHRINQIRLIAAE